MYVNILVTLLWTSLYETLESKLFSESKYDKTKSSVIGLEAML